MRRRASDYSGFYARLREAWGVQTDQALAQALQLSYEAFRTGKSTGATSRFYRAYLLWFTVYHTGVSPMWLEHGTGPKEDRSRRLLSLSPALQEAIRLTDGHPPAERTLAQCARLLASEEPRWAESLTTVAESLEEWSTRSRAARDELLGRPPSSAREE